MTKTGLVRLIAMMRAKYPHGLSDQQSHYLTINGRKHDYSVLVIPMGQASSSGKSLQIWTFYSRTFETMKRVDDFDELFLHGYGDLDEIEAIPPDNAHTGLSRTEANDEDCDYPIERIHANLGVSGYPDTHRLEDPTFPPSKFASGESQMSESRESQRTALQSRYQASLEVPSRCFETREKLRRCYARERDILDCDEQVRRYAECTRAAIHQRLVK